MSNNLKRVAVLGASGSIGGSVLDVLDRYGEELGLEIALLSARSRGRELYDRFRDRKVTVISDDNFGAHGTAAHVKGTEALSKPETYENIDVVVNGIGGIGGTLPSFAAVEAGAKLVTANKESIVAAGKMLLKRAKERSVPVIPVDSEHSAAFQCLLGEDAGSVEKIILTASGGAFRDMSAEEIARTRAAEALKHPNWKMGVKVTVDSATMANKGLELIEATQLFGLPEEKIDIVVHPQSIVHSMVKFADGSVLAQLAPPSMTFPIQNCLFYPRRFGGVVPSLDFSQALRLDFRAPDYGKYKCLRLARACSRRGGILPAVFNAANEIAVDAFLRERIPFLEIPEIVERTLEAFPPREPETLEDVLAADAEARRIAAERI